MSKDSMIVIKSNELVQKVMYTLDKTEIKIINYLIASLPDQKNLTEFPTMEVKINDIKDFLKFDKRNKNYYFTTLKNLRNARYYIEEIDEKGKKYKTPFAWLDQNVRIYENEGYIQCKFNYLLLPYLSQLQQYVKYDLDYISEMSSKYSVRLYELLLSWKTAKKVEFSIDELRVRLDAEQKSYNNFNLFKSRVLDGAINEINSQTDLQIEYEISKTFRKKVTHLLFKITSRKNNVVIIDNTNDIIDVDYNLIEDINSLYDEKNERFGYYYIEIKDALKDYSEFSNDEIDYIYILARDIISLKTNDLIPEYEKELEIIKYLHRLALSLKADTTIRNKYKYLIGILNNKKEQAQQNEE